MNLENSPLDDSLIELLKKENFVNLTPVQEKAIPAIMDGKDVIVSAKTVRSIVGKRPASISFAAISSAGAEIT